MFDKIKSKIKSMIGKRSFSQCGEDLILDYILKSRGVKKPFYLDIGAFHPEKLSNTNIFYKRGCKGINIEPNPESFSIFLKERKKDINLNFGIGDRNASMDYYFFKDSTLNTFSAEEVENYVSLYEKTNLEKYCFLKKVNIQVVDINTLLEKYNLIDIDFVSLDAEGMDLNILKCWDFKSFSPKIFCVESVEHSHLGIGKKRNEIIEFMSNNNYLEIAFTGLNSILVRKDFYFHKSNK